MSRFTFRNAAPRWFITAWDIASSTRGSILTGPGSMKTWSIGRAQGHGRLKGSRERLPPKEAEVSQSRELRRRYYIARVGFVRQPYVKGWLNDVRVSGRRPRWETRARKSRSGSPSD